MSEEPRERRDVSRDIADIRVSVAQLAERSLAQTETLGEIKHKLDSTVTRGEYDARHNEVDQKADKAMKVAGDARDENLRRQGADRVWRIIYTSGLAVIGALAAYPRH